MIWLGSATSAVPAAMPLVDHNDSPSDHRPAGHLDSRGSRQRALVGVLAQHQRGVIGRVDVGHARLPTHVGHQARGADQAVDGDGAGDVLSGLATADAGRGGGGSCLPPVPPRTARSADRATAFVIAVPTVSLCRRRLIGRRPRRGPGQRRAFLQGGPALVAAGVCIDINLLLTRQNQPALPSAAIFRVPGSQRTGGDVDAGRTALQHGRLRLRRCSRT